LQAETPVIHKIYAKNTYLFTRFGRADPAQAVPKKTTLPNKLATVSAVFVCIFVKCRCYIYMDDTFTLQLARASDI
jgi:hypothetical protein